MPASPRPSNDLSTLTPRLLQKHSHAHTRLSRSEKISLRLAYISGECTQHLCGDRVGWMWLLDACIPYRFDPSLAGDGGRVGSGDNGAFHAQDECVEVARR